MKRLGATHKIRLATLVPMGVVLVLFLIGSLANLYAVSNRNILIENDHRLDQMRSGFQQAVESEYRAMNSFLEFVIDDADIREAYLGGDRAALQEIVEPLFRSLQAVNTTTHFEFTTPDQACFLRVQDPRYTGDRIERATLENAVSNGRLSQGIELSGMGALTIRVVRPWFHEGQIIGYLELGKEVRKVTPRVRQILDLEMAVFVQKRFLSREEWLQGQQVFGYEGTWDRFHEYVMVEGQLHEIHEGMLDHVHGAGSPIVQDQTFRVDEHGVCPMGGAIPLRDVTGTQVAFLLGFWDATDLVDEQQAIMGYLGLGITGASLILLLFLGLYLGKVEGRMRNANSTLQETIRQQQADAEALIWNEKKLQREMRQREKAESHLKKQVAEIAAAREAALNMMEDTDLARRSAENSNRELAHAMAETERLRQEAVNASHAKSRFLANMSHEIRTPMNGVLGMTDLLATTGLSAQQRGYLSVITTSGHSLLEIINDILDFSKIEAGMMELDEVEYPLWDAVEDVCDTMAMTAQSKGLDLVIRLQSDVPRRVKGDPGRLRQVLVNLIGNALKFTHVGQVMLTVERDPSVRDRTMVRFRVEDTGIGIPPDREQSLFDAFSQADSSTTRRFGGTGLGLSISRRLVTLMNGEIGVKSELGQGSEFWFTVAVEEIAEAAASVGWGDPGYERIPRALVAVANESLGAWLAQSLQPYVDEIARVTDGREATGSVLEVDQEISPWDLILLDEELSDGAAETIGHWLAAQDAADRPRTFLLSPLVAGKDRCQVVAQGFAGLLNKPVRIRSLLSQILEPAAGCVEAADRETAQAAANKPEPLWGEGRKVLLVDDNLVNRKVGQGMLKKLGCDTTVAVNGLDAIMILERVRFELVLMDVQMPELDGYATTLKIRDPESQVLDHDVPVVAMTANAMEGDREKCLHAGMDGYVSKPVNLQKLREALDELQSPDRPARLEFSQMRHPDDKRQGAPVTA